MTLAPPPKAPTKMPPPWCARCEGRKPYLSLEGMRILQRLLKPQNPKIGDIKVENLIDNTIVKKIEDSDFVEKMNAEYGGR